MNISIIIPNYNGEKLLQKNLPKILDAVSNYKKGEVEIIIPDDPSTDKSAEVIKSFIKNIAQKNITGKTIENRNKKLAGFARNVNRGAQLATGDILILLNSDVFPHKDFLQPLLKHFEDNNVFAIGCLDESIENGEKVLRGRGVGSFRRGFLNHQRGEVGKNNTLWVSGGSGAFRKSIWDKLKGMDNLYDPFYWEDIDLSFRALKAGYTILFEPKSVVIHEHEEGVVKNQFSKNFVKKIAYRNQFIFVWKNITDANLLLYHFLWLPYNLLKALSDKDWMFLAGFWLAIRSLPGVFESRGLAKKYFIKKDSQVLRAYRE